MHGPAASRPPPATDVWIVVPAYNEGPVVGGVIRELTAAYPNVVVVDDGSDDDTSARVQNVGATVISHARCRESIIKAGDGILENPAMYSLPEDFWTGTRVEAPALSFEREMIIDLGGITVKLIHSGVASHSAGSIVVAVPEQKVLFTGDILFTDFHPYLGEGDLPGWAKTLDMIHAMDVDHIIPGHGPLSTKKDLEEMKNYLAFFDKKATELCGRENDVEKIVATMLKTLPKRAGGHFIVGMNLKARYLK